MTDLVADFRKGQVGALAAVVQACAEDQLDTESEVANIIARMRELYFFSPDLRGMVEQLKDIALRNNLIDWAKRGNNSNLADLAWGRINDAAEQLLTELPLYQRDWSQGPIEPLFGPAIAGWVDLADSARRARSASVRNLYIDDLELLVGTMTVFKYGATENFKILESPAVQFLENIFQTILERSDLDLNMFPASLTYFGSDGLQVLNRLISENEDLYSSLLRFADQGLFDDKDAAAAQSNAAAQLEAVSPPIPAAAPVVASFCAPSMTKGANVSLTKQAPSLTAVTVALGWDARTTSGASFDLDATAIACGENKRVLSDQHFIFYNNPTSPDGTIVHAGANEAGDCQVFTIDLASTPASITNVIFPVSIYEGNVQGLTFGQVRNAYIRVLDESTGAELARFDLTENASTEIAMVFGELYRRGTEWTFRAIGQGYVAGLAGIARDYGVDVG
jgi:tellurium resistance protein TerD